MEKASSISGVKTGRKQKTLIRRQMKKFIYSLILVLASAVVANAQDIRANALFTNKEVFKFNNDPTATENRQGFNLEGDFGIFKKEAGVGSFRIGAVGSYQRILGENVEFTANGREDDVDRFAFGPRVSFQVGPIEPYAGVGFGFKTNYDKSLERTYVRVWTAGLAVPFTAKSRFAAIPFFIEREFSGSAFNNGITNYGAGIQIRLF